MVDIATIVADTGGLDGRIGEIVVETTGPKVQVRCANATETEIAIGYYFWGLTEGYVNLIGEGNVTDGGALMPAASGTVILYVEATGDLGNHAFGIALGADVATTFYVPCYIKTSFNKDVIA